MASHHQVPRLNPLSQIPLMKSPFVQFPQAVTLPYDYTQLPSQSALPGLPILPEPKPAGLNSGAARMAAIESSRARLAKWETESQERKLREARRIAPGFLDTGITMLTPTTLAPSAEQTMDKDGTTGQGTNVHEEYEDQFASLKF